MLGESGWGDAERGMLGGSVRRMLGKILNPCNTDCQERLGSPMCGFDKRVGWRMYDGCCRLCLTTGNTT